MRNPRKEGRRKTLNRTAKLQQNHKNVFMKDTAPKRRKEDVLIGRDRTISRKRRKGAT